MLAIKNGKTGRPVVFFCGEVIRRKDEELLRVHSALADLSQHVKEGQLAEEAAELFKEDDAL